jgi:predicted phage terminase large subunit-like protein
VRDEGDLLWPEREGRAELDAAKLRLGAYGFACQYQQNPVPRGGNFYKRDWFGRFATIPDRFDETVVSLDTAFKETESADYSAAVVIGIVRTQREGGPAPGFYLLYAWHGKVAFGELKRVAVSLYEQWRPSAVLIEDKASGQSLIQELRVATAMPIRPIKVDLDKLSRAAAAEPTVEAGLVRLLDGAPWAEDFLAEVCAFPAAPHDDWVDCFTQAINYLRQPTGTTPEQMLAIMGQAFLGIRPNPSALGAGSAAHNAPVDAVRKRLEMVRKSDPSWHCQRCKAPIMDRSYIDGGVQKWHVAGRCADQLAARSMLEPQPTPPEPQEPVSRKAERLVDAESRRVADIIKRNIPEV